VLYGSLEAAVVTVRLSSRYATDEMVDGSPSILTSVWTGHAEASTG
jgi:hypothetical protein